MAVLLVAGVVLILSKVPATYPPVEFPIPAPVESRYAAQGLDGFASPYLGHTGSWDGKGGTMWGGTKATHLDAEVAMGLRWTFMSVYWRAMEPDGPVDPDPDHEQSSEWRALDDFVIAAQERGLNILMQAPVIGGNAGGPPEWAGRREPEKSAPKDLEAAAEFAGKLVARYRPGGTLAQAQGWGSGYGVRAWELDNEPESYFTHWDSQAGDYAEFATRVARRIKAEDPDALVLTPAIGGGGHGLEWVRQALDARTLEGSPAYRATGAPYSIGPVTDVVSFHCYEGLDTAFAGTDRTVERAFGELRSVFEQLESQPGGQGYGRKQEYWHTEGNFDFLGILSRERRAAWRWQFFTRAFAAGIRKVCVMDASPLERVAVEVYVRELADPFPMIRAPGDVDIRQGEAEVFRHPMATGSVWVLWAPAGAGEAVVEVPAVTDTVTVWRPDGSSEWMTPKGGKVRLNLPGDRKMAPPVLVVDRAEDPPGR